MTAGCGVTPLGVVVAGLLRPREIKMQVNEQKSGVIKGVGTNKYLVVIDGAELNDVTGPAARTLAQDAAAAAGFGAGGMCDQPVTGPLGEDGEMLEGAAALNPATTVAGFRTEITFAQRF